MRESRRSVTITVSLLALALSYSDVQADSVSNEVADPQLANVEKRALRGETWAAYDLGLRYATGSRRDINLARKYLSQAAEKGFAPAMDLLGQLSLEVEPVDKKVALEWFEKSARLGDVAAMGHAGIVYNQLEEFEKARSLFKSAADLGYPESMVNLAIYYARGLGGNRDCAAARALLDRAISIGHRGAIRYLAALFGQAPSGGDVTIIVKEKWSDGGPNIRTNGANSYCGVAGRGGNVSIDIGSLDNANVTVSARGGNSGGDEPPKGNK